LLFFNISAFFFSYFSVTAIYVIFLPKVLQMLNYTPIQIGAIFALAPLMRFLVPFIFLKHINLDKKVFYIALISVLVSSLLFYVTIHSFYLFMIPNLIIGASLGLILPFIETYAMEYLKKEKFGRSRLFGSIGFMLTGIVLARELDSYLVGLNFYLFFVILVLLFGFLITHKNSDFKRVKNSSNNEHFDLKKATYLWLSLFFMQISFGAFYNFFTIYETQKGISLETTSYLWAFGVICEIVFFYFQAPLLKRNLVLILKIAVFSTVIRWLLLFLFPSSLFFSFSSQSLHALSFALHHTVALSLLYSLYENKKLAAQFYYGFSFGLGGFFGSLIAGYFYGDYLYLYASIVAFISFLVLFKMPTELKQNF
jgi:PPP family 3-phenylpropionic acid transporter